VAALQSFIGGFMNTLDAAAQTKSLRRIVRICTIKCALFVLAIAGVELLAVRMIDSKGWDFEWPIVSIVTFAFFIACCYQRAKFARKFNNPGEESQCGNWHPLLHDALQKDLRELAARAGLRKKINLRVLKGKGVSIAWVYSYTGSDYPATVYLPAVTPSLGYSRAEMNAAFGHEVGHPLLGSDLWDLIRLSLEVFTYTCLLMMIAIKLYFGLNSHALAAGNPDILQVLAFLAYTGLTCSAVGPVLKAIEGKLSRMQEGGCDEISEVLVGPGLMEALLEKTGRLPVKQYIVQTRKKIVPWWPILDRIWANLIATHPQQVRPIFERRSNSK
jgi:Zn-dependent protease with chaperone function